VSSYKLARQEGKTGRADMIINGKRIFEADIE
jgi:hypothetical protein